jgi:hypothetical protein
MTTESGGDLPLPNKERMPMKFYPLIDWLTREETEHFGVKSRITYLQSLCISLPGCKIQAVATGEKRPPKKGEWYLSGAIIGAYRADGNLETPYHIARLVRVERKTVEIVAQV